MMCENHTTVHGLLILTVANVANVGNVAGVRENAFVAWHWQPDSEIVRWVTVLMQRLSHPTETVLSNKITRNNSPIIQRTSQTTIRTAT